MKKISTVFFLFCIPLFAKSTAWTHSEPPTYTSDPAQVEEYATGYVRPQGGQPLTSEQFQAQKELDDLSAQGEISYEYDVTQIGKYSTGYVRPDGISSTGPTAEDDEPEKEPEHKEIDFRQLLGDKTPEVLNQGKCGSCVVFSFTENAQWSMALRGIEIPKLSPQHLMSCGGSGGQCRGDDGENVAGRLIKLGALASADEYPYKAKTSKCQFKDSMETYGQFKSYKTIKGDFQSIVEALNNRQPISVGVAADSRFMSYKSGVYNGFGSMRTNHYVMIVGATCGTSVDKDHNCLFDANRKLVNGNNEGQVIVLNSWKKSWGDGGYITMQFENKQGKRNNNIAGGGGNAQVVDTKIPWTPPAPSSWDMESSEMILHVTVQPGAKYSPEKAKSMLQLALDQTGK